MHFPKIYIFLVFAHIILYCKLLQKMINFSNSLIVNEVLALSKTGCHDNTTLVGSNGTVASSSFVLASVFPVVRDILETHVQFDDRMVILIPDLVVGELDTFLLNLYEHTVVFGVSRDLLELMRPVGVFMVEEISNIQSNTDTEIDIDMD